MASRTGNRVDGVQKQTSRRRYSNGPCRRRKLTATKTRSLTDGDTPSTSVRQLRQTTSVATLIHHYRTRLSTRLLIVRPFQLFTTRLLSFTGFSYISSRLLPFTVSQRLSHDERSHRRSLTYIRTVQLSQVISCKSLTDTSTYGTYTQERPQYRRPAGKTRPRSCDHSCQRLRGINCD